MNDLFAPYHPNKSPPVKFLWEWAKKEDLPLPRSAVEICSSMDGNMPIYWWITEEGEEIRFSFNCAELQAVIEYFDENSQLIEKFQFQLKLLQVSEDD